MDLHRQLRAHEGGKVLQGRTRDLRHGTIVEEQALLRLFTHALDFAEGALDGSLGTEVAVKGNAEAVRFVADVLEHLQGLGIPVDEQGIRIPPRG